MSSGESMALAAIPASSVAPSAGAPTRSSGSGRASLPATPRGHRPNDPTHRSPLHAALGHQFIVEAEDVTAGRLVESLLIDLLAARGDRPGAPGTTAPTEATPATAEESVTRYQLAVQRRDGSMTWRLLADDTVLTESPSPAQVLGHLVWHVNRQAIARSPHLVRMHAAAASRAGVGVVLPASMESGKTTLVAGLVRAGFRYLSDEVAALDPGSGQLVAYPKPLSIDPGSWEVLQELRPVVEPGLESFLDRQWQVPASSIRPDAVAASARPRLVVSPRYVAGARTALEPVGRAELLELVIGQTFDFRQQVARDLPALAQLLAGCACYRLVVGSLDEAVAIVEELAAEVSA